MLKYEVGPQKALQSSAVDTLLWEMKTIPSGPMVKGVSFIQTGTNHDLDSIATIEFLAGGTQFINLANDAQLLAVCNSLGKKAVTGAVQAWSVPFQNIYGWPLMDSGCAAPATGDLSIRIVTDGTGSAVGTITPIFWLNPEQPATSYPKWLTAQFGSGGTPSNQSHSITDAGTYFRGFVLDETNLTNIKFTYGSQDIIPQVTMAQLNELTELWQGTTVTSPRAVWFYEPLLVDRTAKFLLNGSGAVGQILPILDVPYATK